MTALAEFYKNAAFRVESGMIEGQRYVWAIARCCTCPAEKKLNINGKVGPSSWIEGKIEQAGWEYQRHKDMWICPDCLRNKFGVKRAMEKEENMGNANPAVALTPRPLTIEEKAKARRMLDEHFDDTRGCYLDGYSDNKIALTLDVPVASIAAMRETAYGPIKQDDELMMIKADIMKLQTSFRAAVEQMSVDCGKVLDRLVAAEKRLGIR